MTLAEITSTDLAMKLLDPSKRISLLPILTAALFAAFVFWRATRHEGPFRFGAFARWLLPREIYRHRSTAVDIQVTVLFHLTDPVKIVLFGLTVAIAGAAVAAGFRHLFGPPPFLMEVTFAATALLAVLLFLATDLATYIIHRLSHEVPMLWAFHRVHHSAEVLNPITLLRKHPVYDVLNRIVELVLLAPLYGIILYFWPPGFDATVALGVRWGFSIFALAAGNLRHSHVWLSFGPLERFLVSPAQHQIHHSQAEWHLNRNYGEVLAVWDWMFGTLYVPSEKEELVFGLRDEAQPHPNLWRALAEPFVYAWNVRPRRKGAARVRQVTA